MPLPLCLRTLPWVLPLFLAGCIGNGPDYLAADRTASGESRAIRHSHGGNFPYATIEFGDQGNFQDPAQVQVAKDLILGKKKPLLVAFVHGWHSNASSPDEDVKYRFTQLLDDLGKSAAIRRNGFEVVGVYFAWHAKVSENPLIEYPLTFWSRYEVGQRLGSGVDCRAAIADVVEAARSKGRANSRTFLVGHSFGALVLQQAVAQSVNEAKRQGAALAPADLTLFLNPASDSEITRQMIERMQSNIEVAGGGGGGKAGRYPVFASLTSETDRATGALFPIGKKLASSGKVFDHFPERGPDGRVRQVSGRYFYTHTPGHNEYLISHTTSRPQPSTGSGNDAFEENLRADPDPDNPRFKTCKDGRWQEWELTRVGAIDKPTPYWIIKVDRAIMDGHNDILNPQALALMATLYRLNDKFVARTHGQVRLQRTVRAEKRIELQSSSDTLQKIDQAQRMTPAQLSQERVAAPTPKAEGRR